MMTFESSNSQPASFSSCFPLTVTIFFNTLLFRLNMSYAPWEISMYSLIKYFSLGCFEEEGLLQTPPSFIREDARVQIISSMCEGTHSISSRQQSTAPCTPQARFLQSKCSASSQITVEACSSCPSYLSTSKHRRFRLCSAQLQPKPAALP